MLSDIEKQALLIMIASVILREWAERQVRMEAILREAARNVVKNKGTEKNE